MVERLTRDTLDDEVEFEENDDTAFGFEDDETGFYDASDEGLDDDDFEDKGFAEEDDMEAARHKAQQQFKIAMMAVGGFVLVLVVGGALFLFGGSSPAPKSGSSRPIAATTPPAAQPAPVEEIVAPVETPAPAEVDAAFGDGLYEFGESAATPEAAAAITPAASAPALNPTPTPTPAVATALESVNPSVQSLDVMPQIEELEQKLVDQSTVVAAQDQQIEQQRVQIAALETALNRIQLQVEEQARLEAQRANEVSPVVSLEQQLSAQQTRIVELERRIETKRRSEIAINVDKPRLANAVETKAPIRTTAFSPSPARVKQGSAPIVFRGAQPNVVWLSPRYAPDELESYRIGDVVPGLGRLTRIGLTNNDRWYIETEGGRVTEFDQ